MKKTFTFLLFFHSVVCVAQWNSDPSVNTAVCATPLNQLYHEMIPDGSSGSFITWIETDLSTSAQVYAQHISKDGSMLWPPAGIAVAPNPSPQTTLHIISDGNGGAIISWLLNPSGSLHLYAQKISALGQPQWAAGGIEVCPAAELVLFTYKMISDGHGGAIIIWPDSRNPGGQLYGQRISSDGAVLWQPDGLPCSPLYVSEFDAITDTATGGLFISWPRVNGVGYNNDIFIQKISGDGLSLWGADGILICHAAKDQLYNKLISDGKAGAIVLWQDFRQDPLLSQIYGRRVDSSGTVYWDEDGKLICDSVIAASTYFQVISDGAGGGIVAWLDDFVVNFSNTNYLYAQRFDSLGVTHWPGNTIAVWDDLVYRSQFQITTDNEQGSFITWNRVSDTLPVGDEAKDIYNIYAQHLYPDGLTQWPDSGVLISSATQNQTNPQIACVGNGAAIIAWTDLRSGTNYDIYAARLGSSPVPVEWLSFKAVREGNSHVIKWEIANQYNNKGFFIERSADGVHFESIGFVAAQEKSYYFADDNPLEDENYYRLKQIDFDGKFKYSKIVYLYMLLEEVMVIYPNPVTGILKVKTKSTRAILLHILNSYGQVVKIKSINTPGITEINVSNVPAGIYYIKDNSGSLVGKFVKQ